MHGPLLAPAPDKSARIALHTSAILGTSSAVTTILLSCGSHSFVASSQHESRGVVGPPLFSTGGHVPHSPTFWTEIRAIVSPLLQLVTY